MAHFCLGLFLFFIRERREDGYHFKQRRESSSFKHIRFPSLPFSLDTCPCPFLQAVMAWFVVTTFEERTFNKWRQNVRQKRIKMKLWANCGETFFSQWLIHFLTDLKKIVSGDFFDFFFPWDLVGWHRERPRHRTDEASGWRCTRPLWTNIFKQEKGQIRLTKQLVS